MPGPRHHLRDGRLAWLGRPALRALIGAELLAQRAVDLPGRRRRRRQDEALAERLTVVVKTFERPHLLRRLVRSLRRDHPAVRLVVVDDSRVPVHLDGVEVIALPHDVGVSAGKNAGLALVDTPYVAFLDDDYVATRRTDFARVVAVLDAHPDIDLVGGRVAFLPSFRSDDYRRSGLFPTPVPPKRPVGSLVGGLPVYDKVANFFVARTEAVREVGWSPELKRLDHTDFFTRARGVLTTVYDDGFGCLHSQDRFAAAYLEARSSTDADRLHITQRWFTD